MICQANITSTLILAQSDVLEGPAPARCIQSLHRPYFTLQSSQLFLSDMSYFLSPTYGRSREDVPKSAGLASLSAGTWFGAANFSEIVTRNYADNPVSPGMS
jgi:hypothetical protein